LKQIRVEAVGTATVPTEEVVAAGKIQTNPNRVSHVSMPISGRVVSVMVRLGDSVKQGQPLFSIESPDADAALSGALQADATLTQAQAGLLKADADLERTRDLYQHEAIAKKEVLNAENNQAQAKASVEQAQASKKQALRRLEILGLNPGDFGQKVVVHAPTSGKVLNLALVPGEYRNDTNAEVMTIADLSTVWVSADVPESSVRFIQLGEPVQVELTAYPGETIRARVMRIADTVDPDTRTIKVQAEINNASGKLRPEMFGRIRHIESTETRPVIPPGALIQGDGGNLVYVQESPGVFRRTPVTTGNRAGDRIAVLSGLKPGDLIVTDGAMLLKSL
jgi:cobalt-zinc-cadmium efflux system membrane fusion protein